MLGISTPLSTEADGRLVGDLFSKLVENELCSLPCFEEGFMPMAERLDDIMIDCRQAFELMTMMMKGSAMDNDWRCCGRIAAKSIHSNDLIALLLWKPVQARRANSYSPMRNSV
jgi:hypothetical protein